MLFSISKYSQQILELVLDDDQVRRLTLLRVCSNLYCRYRCSLSLSEFSLILKVNSALDIEQAGMLDQHSNGSATNPPVPEPIATETRNDAANTTNDLYTTKKLCLKGLHFKKRPQPEETTEERPVKRIKINAEEPQVISNDGGISNGSNAIQSQPGDIPARTPKKRGRPPRAKGEETPNGEQEDTLAKKPKAPKVKADDDALNGEKDPPAKKPKTPKVKSDVPSVNGEKDPPTKKPKASKVKAEALSGEIDTPTKKQRASKLQVGNPEMGTVKETLTKKEKVAKTKGE